MSKSSLTPSIELGWTYSHHGIFYSRDVANKIKAGRANWEHIIDLINAFSFSERKGVKDFWFTSAERIQVCKLCIQTLFSEYCHDPDDREILQMAFGLLLGYEDIKNVTDRRKKYMNNIENSLKPSSIDRIVRREEDTIIDELSIVIARTIVLKGGSNLNLIRKMPENLILPIPRYASSNRLWGKGPRNKELS